MTVKGFLFVIVQFTAICCLLLFTSINLLSWSVIFQLIGVIVGCFAVWEVRKSKLSIFPELKKDAILVKTGPFKYIRHPMYSGILFFFLPTALTFALIPLFVYAVLVINLVLKMKYEESILKKEFSDYDQYSESTSYIIPMIY